MILVDGVQSYETRLRYKEWSHMVSDVGADELHAFAARLGLERRWSQERPKSSAHHYDITPGKRTLAIQLGALAVSSRELVMRNYDGMRRRGLLPEIVNPADPLGLTTKLGPLTAMILSDGLSPEARQAMVEAARRAKEAPLVIVRRPTTCRKHPLVELQDETGESNPAIFGGRCVLCDYEKAN